MASGRLEHSVRHVSNYKAVLACVRCVHATISRLASMTGQLSSLGTVKMRHAMAQRSRALFSPFSLPPLSAAD